MILMGYNLRSKVQWLTVYEKFLGVQNPFFKKGFGRRRQEVELPVVRFFPIGLEFSESVTRSLADNRGETFAFR
jgi:hypothetical protein